MPENGEVLSSGGEAANTNRPLVHYRHIPARVIPALNTDKPEILGWHNMGPDDLKMLKGHVMETHTAVKYLHQPIKTNDSHLPKTPDQVDETLKILNPDHRFATHIEIMTEYYKKLWESPTFREMANGHSFEFFAACVIMHDYGRNIFNGPFPLTYIDGVSDGILNKNFPTFPRDYMHTIGWITGVKPMPNEDSPISDKFALMLKAIDTLGKIDASTGHLMDPETFFAEDGAYNRWVALQVKNERIPFDVFITTESIEKGKSINKRKRKSVTPEEYAYNDRTATLLGVKWIEQATGWSFSDIRKIVDARVVKESNPTIQ